MTARTAAKKVFVKTFGCQMNVYDSERMTEALAARRLCRDRRRSRTPTSSSSTPATSARRPPRRSIPISAASATSRRSARRAARTRIVAVAGCVAQAEGAEIVRRAPVVDLVVGPQSYHRLPRAGRPRARRKAAPLVETGFPEEDKFAHLPQRAPARAATAFLTVQEGCDKFCTFCVVPYTRGAEYLAPRRRRRGRGAPPRRPRRARDHAARPERQRLSRRRAPTAAPWSLAG